MRRKAPPHRRFRVPPLLEARGLSVSYEQSLALNGVDFVVPGGALVGVLGPNGAGKTTLLRAMAGLVQPSAGVIFFRGERIDHLRANDIARRGVCLIPEGRGIMPGLTVSDNLRLALPREQASVDVVFERFPILKDRLQQPAGTLSGGEQQMLALARAFGERPQVLLVDEPSLGLAPRLVGMIERTLRHLHDKRGRTIVWVEQYAARVLAVADVVYILGRGRVVWAGEPAELRASRVLVRTYLGGQPVE
jgi:branched-chain amino acid transport system ATP-binding protein